MINLVARILLVGAIAWTLVVSMPADGIDRIAQEKSNAVVLILNGPDSEQASSQTGIGTGFLLDENLIVTNHHVISNGNSIFVRGKTSEKTYKAKLIASDEFSDLALVSIDDWKDFSATNMPNKLSFSSSRDLKLGEKVWSIGHPWGLIWSISEGVVSSTSRRIDNNLNYLLQTDTRIFQGNSGGPLLDLDGNVIGVNVKMVANTGGSFGFAIPSDLAVKVIEDLRTKGKVEWAVMGINMGYTEDGKNVMVQGITAGSAAEKAGVKTGDVIMGIMTPHTPIGGISVTSTDQLLDEMAVLHSEDSVTLSIKRDGHLSNLKVMPDRKPSSELMPKK